MKNRPLYIVALWLTAALVVVPLVLSACQISPLGAREKAPYYIGLVDALTGQYAPVGVDVKKGEEMAIAEINAKGGVNGHPLSGIYYDDESAPPRAADLVRKLKDQNVLAIVGAVGIPMALAASEVADAEKVPFIPKTPVPLPSQTGKPGNYVFGAVSYDFDDVADVWIRFAVALGGKRVGFVLTSDPLGDTHERLIKALADKNPGMFEIAGIERMLTTDTDITVQLTKLRAARPDALFLGPSGRPATVVYKNLDLMAWNIPAVSHSANAQRSFIDSVKGFSDRVVLWLTASQLRPDSIPGDHPGGQAEAIRRLATEFNKETGKISSDTVVSGYDSVYSIADALRKLDMDPEKMSVQEMRSKLRDAMETQTFQATNVLVKRTAQNHRGVAGFRFYLAKIQGDWFVPVRYVDYPGAKMGVMK
ncbi:MAG: ABC transporter substrate-binding protein [Chloroflexi bacterium]|nr:ABC transporter substrate-binding protein [Chloroflexota bacterium]